MIVGKPLLLRLSNEKFFNYLRIINLPVDHLNDDIPRILIKHPYTTQP